MSGSDAPPTGARTRPAAATAIALLAALGVLGAAVMVVAHLALELPMLAVAFGLGSAAYVVLCYGAARRRTWAWPLGLVVNAVALAAAAIPWRGLDRSGLPALVSLVALVLLMSRAGRDALLYER